MLSRFSVQKPYTVVVAVIIIIILGIISVSNMTLDLLPSINLPYAVIITAYPGANPESIELSVTRPIEQSMLTLSNIKNVMSVSADNMSIVILEFNETTNMDSAMIEMRENLDMTSAMMPGEVSSPMIMRINPDMLPVSVVTVAVENQTISESSRYINDIIIPEFESIPGVASVSAAGLIDRGIEIIIDQEKLDHQKNMLEEQLSSAMLLPSLFMPNMDLTTIMQNMGIDPNQLQDFEITKDMIGGIIQGQNINMPAGYLTEKDTSYLVRIGDRIRTIDELRQLPVFALPFPNLAPITLEDLTTINLVDNSESIYAKVNGQNAAALIMQKQTDYSTSDVANRIREHSNELMTQNDNLTITTLMDQGDYINTVINSLVNNIIYGGLLALLILFLFLKNIKPTIVIAFTIPISIVATFVLMYFSNVTLNIISMGGLALGIGMLVDNSIVVIENIYRKRHNGVPIKEAAIDGAKQVAGAITASTLTTIAVFFPIVFTYGLTREIFTDMGLTIAYSLGTSLLTALTLVPMIASRLMHEQNNKRNRIIDRISNQYAKLVNIALNKKALILTAVIALLAASIFGAYTMGTEFIPTADTDQLSVNVTLPGGTSFEEAVETADQITHNLREINDIETIGAFFGGSMFGMMGGGFNLGSSEHESISFYLILKEKRSASSSEIAQLIRAKTEGIEGDVVVNESNMDLSALSGGAIVITVKGREFDVIQTIAQDVAKLVADVEGTVEISDGLEETAPELRITVDRQKGIAKGLTAGQVLMAVSQQLSTGNAITSLTIGTDEYDVFIKDKYDLDDLGEILVESPFDEMVKISDIAVIEQAQGFTSITRENQQRYVTVSAEIADGYNIGNISREIDRQLAIYDIPEGYSVEYGGEQLIILESFGDLYLILIIGVILIYLIMVAQFQSLLSPFIVMFTIPLAFTGGFFGLIITGNSLSIVAFLGLIILAGVVVNNGIVFIDYINILRQSGMKKHEAIIQAGTVRLRPILMTALTTVIALSTMSLGVGMGTELIQPMAISAISGLIYATLLTLFIVPILYDLFNRETN